MLSDIYDNEGQSSVMPTEHSLHPSFEIRTLMYPNPQASRALCDFSFVGEHKFSILMGSTFKNNNAETLCAAKALSFIKDLAQREIPPE